MVKQLNYEPEADNYFKKHINQDVYSAAKERIYEVINSVDECLVGFSGGKDSLVTLYLVQECYNDLGINKKLKVYFCDEEFIPPTVLDFVINIYNSHEFDFYYYAIPLKSNRVFLNSVSDYVQWDRNREWLRQPPDFAITLDDDEYFVYDQYNRDSFICRDIPGRVAIFNGMRADESLNRLKACYKKPYKTYINQTKFKRIIHSKPLYDWTERDIFLYMYKNDIQYCSNYDHQLYNRQCLRVASSLHTEASGNIPKLKTDVPEYFNRVCEIFPEILTHARYLDDISKKTISGKYSHDVNGLVEYLNREIPDKGQRQLAAKHLKRCLKYRTKHLDDRLLGGYPIKYLFDCLLNGTFKRGFMPMRDNDVTKEYYLFEGKTVSDYLDDYNKIHNKK